MKRRYVPIVVLVLGVIASTVVALAGTAPRSQHDAKPIGPAVPRDTGAGELLLVVLGGVFPSRAEAHAANDQIVFGDLAGFYVVPVAQFQGFREQVDATGDFALVSAFRTENGAREFVALAAGFGYQATILPGRVRSLGGLYAGLGQESHPDGSGPLVGPLPESLP